MDSGKWGAQEQELNSNLKPYLGQRGGVICTSHCELINWHTGLCIIIHLALVSLGELRKRSFKSTKPPLCSFIRLFSRECCQVPRIKWRNPIF